MPSLNLFSSANGTKPLVQRSGIAATIGTAAISLAQQLVPLWISNVQTQQTIIILVTGLVSAFLAALGNPSGKVNGS